MGASDRRVVEIGVPVTARQIRVEFADTATTGRNFVNQRSRNESSPRFSETLRSAIVD